MFKTIFFLISNIFIRILFYLIFVFFNAVLCFVLHEQNKLNGFAQQVFSSDGGTLLILEGGKRQGKEKG
jgi:hypothetical protein